MFLGLARSFLVTALAMIFCLFFTRGLTEYAVQAGMAAVSGIMVFMSIRELVPVALRYLNPLDMAKSFSFGMYAMFFSIHWLNFALGLSGGEEDAAVPKSQVLAYLGMDGIFKGVHTPSQHPMHSPMFTEL